MRNNYSLDHEPSLVLISFIFLRCELELQEQIQCRFSADNLFLKEFAKNTLFCQKTSELQAVCFIGPKASKCANLGHDSFTRAHIANCREHAFWISNHLSIG